MDIRFTVPNTPGAIGRAARAVADAGINVRGMGCDIRPGEQWAFIHFMVDESVEAIRALEGVGCEILDVHEVDIVEAAPKVGALAEICEDYAARGENIEVLYAGFNNQVVVGTENMRRPIQGGRVSDASYADPRASDP